jgi:hypothetical protein
MFFISPSIKFWDINRMSQYRTALLLNTFPASPLSQGTTQFNVSRFNVVRKVCWIG